MGLYDTVKRIHACDNKCFPHIDQFLPIFFVKVPLTSIIYGIMYKMLFQTRKYVHASLQNYSHSTIEENTIRVECFYSFGVASLLVALEEVILGGPGIQSANTEDALANITRRGAHLTTLGIPA